MSDKGWNKPALKELESNLKHKIAELKEERFRLTESTQFRNLKGMGSDDIRRDFAYLKNMSAEQKKRLQQVQEEIDLAGYYLSNRINAVHRVKFQRQKDVLAEVTASHKYYIEKEKPKRLNRVYTNELEYFEETRHKFQILTEQMYKRKANHSLQSQSAVPSEYFLPTVTDWELLDQASGIDELYGMIKP